MKTPGRARMIIALARTALVTIAIIAAGAILLKAVDKLSPARDWMIWRLLTLWSWVGLFVAACLSLGGLVCRRLMRDVFDELPGLEAAVLAMAVGVQSFVMLMYAGGAFRLYGPTFAVALPVGMVVAGCVRSPLPARCLGWIRSVRLETSPLQLGVLAFGVVAVALMYLHIIQPGAANFDAHWTHLAIAQDMVREKGPVAFGGDWGKCFPHLASVIYAWDLMVPRLDFSMHKSLALHTEFVLVLWTLAGIVAAVRWLTNSTTGRQLSWVALFLFPNIFIYDSALGGAADHVAAFFILPACLALARASERFVRPGAWAVGGLVLGSALVTKAQSAYLALPVCILIAVYWFVKVLGRVRRNPAAPTVRQLVLVPAALIGCTLLAASPYLLENLVFYRNPVYPFMQNVFTGSRPTLPDAAALVSDVLTPASLRGPEQLVPRLKSALELVFTFSFEPHYSFANNWPYFGFLFTLLSPLALVLPGARRLRMGALIGAGSIFVWAMTYLVDRNLQVFLPLLVAVTAGVMARIWELGIIPRLALTGLVALQVLWGADRILAPVWSLVEHARQGLAGQVDVFDVHSRQAITRALPRDAVVVQHAQLPSLGLDRKVLHDWVGMQAAIDYRSLRNAREVYDRFRQLGVTHVTWAWGDPTGNRQEEIVFGVFAKLHAVPMGRFGRNELAAMPTKPPRGERPYRVLAMGIGAYPDGIYSVEQMGVGELLLAPRYPRPLTELKDIGDIEQSLAGIDVVMISPERVGQLSGPLARDFQQIPAAPGHQLYLSRPRLIEAKDSEVR